MPQASEPYPTPITSAIVSPAAPPPPIGRSQTARRSTSWPAPPCKQPCHDQTLEPAPPSVSQWLNGAMDHDVRVTERIRCYLQGNVQLPGTRTVPASGF